jgi:hypothetical protein
MTKITARPMPMDVLILLDTPKNGQIPKNWANTTLLTSTADMMIRMYSIYLSVNESET